jgi:hypothetical protein
MIERVRNADRINEILNHPGVRPWVADASEGIIDISEKAANSDNVILVGRYGGFVVFKYWLGLYECHTAVLPEGRGSWAKEFAEAGAHFMFTRTDCVEIMTRVPEGHVGAAALTRSMGFEFQFSTPPETLFRGRRVSCSIYSLSLQRWAMRQSEDKGREFHDWLNAQVKDQGDPHEPDPWHNRIIGVVVDMARGRQTAKGVTWYNRWAVAARHPPIYLINHDPPQIRFDAGILTLQPDGELHYAAEQPS